MEKLLVIIMVATMVLNMTRDVPSSEEIDEGNVTEVSDEYEEDDVKNHLWKDEYSKIGRHGKSRWVMFVNKVNMKC